jgi:hypothetical protein
MIFECKEAEMLRTVIKRRVKPSAIILLCHQLFFQISKVTTKRINLSLANSLEKKNKKSSK